MTRQRGQWFPTRFGAQATATYHPAYVFRLNGEAREATIEALAADLRSARLRLEEARTDPPADFGAHIKSEVVKYAKIVKQVGLKAE